MADEFDPEEAAARLEAAIERIARNSARGRGPEPARGDSVTAEVAARLDSLIGRLRAELGRAV